MKRRTLVSLLALGATGATGVRAEDDSFVLVTQQQLDDEQRAQATQRPEPPPSRKRGVFPMIRVIDPRAGDGGVPSPLRLEFHFETSRDAHIVPATFRVLYGILKFDLTDTLRPHARWNEQGVVVAQAMVPAGTHRLLVQIADDRGRVNEQELKLKVVM